MKRFSNDKNVMISRKSNHPRKGSTIKVEPLRDVATIETIKQLLKRQPGNLCLFVLSINTAYRAGELLSLQIKDVSDLQVGDSLDVKQSKTNQYRRASLNQAALFAVRGWLTVHPCTEPSAPLFLSRKGGATTVARINHLIKNWCHTIGLNGNYGSHTLRKIWGYQ